MAFTGSATIVQVSDRQVRVTGLSLAAGASGTIGLHEKTVPADVSLPAAFAPRPYDMPESSTPVALQSSVKVTVDSENPGAVQMPIGIVKTGTTPLDFVATISNPGGDVTGNLEIYVEFH